MESLVDDLGSLGLKFEFRRGVDWGYGRSMDRALDGKSHMWFTSEAVERLSAIGALVGKQGSRNRNSFVHYFGYTTVWKGMYRMSFYLHRSSVSVGDSIESMYFLVGSCGDSGFGISHFQYHFRPRTVRMFQQEIEDLVTSLRG
jgi:hypothetical protein